MQNRYRYALVEVGCLECHNPTDLLGAFDSLAEVEAALPAHAEGRYIVLAAGVETPGGEEPWHGDSIYVVLDLASVVRPPVARSARAPSTTT